MNEDGVRRGRVNYLPFREEGRLIRFGTGVDTERVLEVGQVSIKTTGS